MKTCTKCGETKPLEEFGVHKLMRDGLRNHCKICHCTAVKAAYAKDPEKVRERARAWYWEHRDIALERHRQYRIANQDAIREQGQRYRIANREVIQKKAAKRYAENIDRRNEYGRRSRKEMRTDGYVRHLLRESGFDNQSIEIIKLKREQIRLHRLAKEFKQAINERNEDEQG